MKSARTEYTAPPVDLPREKALERGIESLSDTELLALLIGSGCRRQSVLQVAEQARSIIDNHQNDRKATRRYLTEIPGLGSVKTLMLSAALELGRRRYSPGQKAIRGPADAWESIRHYGDRNRELFLAICLNGAHHMVKFEVVTIGLVNRSLVHPREVYAPALAVRATALIVAHNHPSGNLDPSQEDIEVTRRLKEAGEILGIELLDHLIFSSESFFSLRENEIL